MVSQSSGEEMQSNYMVTKDHIRSNAYTPTFIKEALSILLLKYNCFKWLLKWR